MLNRRGFTVNESKTKFISNASAQRVTEFTVNEKVAVSKDYKRNLRQEIYYALKFGFENAVLEGRKREYIKYGVADVERYYNHLIEKFNYVLQGEPQNKWFLKTKDELMYKYTILT